MRRPAGHLNWPLFKKEVAGLLNAVPGSFEWMDAKHKMDWMQTMHRLRNAVLVVWLPAGQSLQTH